MSRNHSCSEQPYQRYQSSTKGAGHTVSQDTIPYARWLPRHGMHTVAWHGMAWHVASCNQCRLCWGCCATIKNMACCAGQPGLTVAGGAGFAGGGQAVKTSIARGIASIGFEGANATGDAVVTHTLVTSCTHCRQSGRQHGAHGSHASP